MTTTAIPVDPSQSSSSSSSIPSTTTTKQMTSSDTAALVLQKQASSLNLPIHSKDFAQRLDESDPLRQFKSEFCIPSTATVVHPGTPNSNNQDPCVYLCGNSLGLQSVHARKLVNEELDVWAESGVHGHFDHRHQRPWADVDKTVVARSAKIVGAKPEEVAIMNTLTTNLHLGMLSFYCPTKTRFKIFCEEKAFPSDHYAVSSQIKFHGYDPKDALILAKPRAGEHTLRTSDILDTLEKHGSEIALVMFSGVQYYTGQFFEMEKITAKAHEKGCMVGWDLAHAVGNVPLYLHDWGVDFACWCSYKYLNSGPGAIAGFFVHEKHAYDFNRPRLSGWWGAEDRFAMLEDFQPRPGAQGYQLSNPSVFATIPLLSSLVVFEKTSMEELRRKSVLLTGYLEVLLKQFFPPPAVSIITPSDPSQRGCQLSLLFGGKNESVKEIFEALLNAGVVCDKREPNVIRIAPVPLYNGFMDVWRFIEILKSVVKV